MPTALIIGAGVGGLAAGIALRRAGWDVEILERATRPRELGFALMLAPNAMRALAHLGLADRVTSSGFVTSRGEIRKANGEVLKRLDFDDVRRRLGAPTVCVMRTALHGALLEALEPAALRLGCHAVGFAALHDGVTSRLANGEVRHGRVLIGADGVHSAVRKTLHPDESPARPSGLLAVRGLARGAAPPLEDASAAFYLGRGCEAGVARAGADEVYWYLSVRMPHVHRPPSEDARALVAPFLEQLHEPFRAMVASTAEDDLRLDVLVDREPLDRWGAGPVTLLGDAAHPMLPHAGQGGAQAIEDAVVLGRMLSAAPSPEMGLREYERTRIPRTRAVVRLARRNARLGALEGAAACAFRDVLIRLVPSSLVLRSQIDLGLPVGPAGA